MKIKHLFISLFLGLIVIFIIGQTYILIKPEKKLTNTIVEGLAEDYYESYGVIIRDEKVISSKDGQKIFPIVTQGDRVAANSSVASSYSNESSNLLKKISEAEKKLINKLSKDAPEALLKSFTITKINKTISEELDKMMLAVNKSDYSAAKMIESGIKDLTNEKVDYLLENVSNFSKYKDLKNEIESLNADFKRNSGTINSKASGIVSYLVDGYEGALKPSKIEKINYKLVDKVYNDKSIDQPQSENKLKIIKGFQGCLALVVDDNIAAEIEVGATRILNISDLNITLTGSLISKNLDGEKPILIFQFDKYMDELLGLRKVKVGIGNSSTLIEGLKVNESALFDYNAKKTKAYIYIVRANIVRKRKIEIVAKDKNGVIIKDTKPEERGKVDLYDEYIVKYDSVKEGDILD